METCDHGIELGMGCSKCDHPRGKQLTVGADMKMKATGGRGGGLPPRKMSVAASRQTIAGMLMKVVQRRLGEISADNRPIGGPNCPTCHPKQGGEGKTVRRLKREYCLP
jgi:hypothetical protein